MNKIEPQHVDTEKLREALNEVRNYFKDIKLSYLRYYYNTLQLYLNIEKVLQSIFFEAGFEGYDLNAYFTERFKNDGLSTDSQKEKFITDCFFTISMVGFTCKTILDRCVNGEQLQEVEKAKLRRMLRLKSQPSQPQSLEHTTIQEAKRDDTVTKFFKKTFPKILQEEGTSTAGAAATCTDEASKPAPRKQAVLASDQKEETAHTDFEEEAHADTDRPSASYESQESDEENEDEKELALYYNDWFNEYILPYQNRPPEDRRTGAPTQEEKVIILSNNKESSIFLDVVLGRQAYQTLKRGHFDAFLRAVQGYKLKMTPNGYLTIRLTDQSVETKYYVPNYSGDESKKAMVFTIHQPHGSGEFPRRTVYNFFKPQLLKKGYDKVEIKIK